MGRVRVAARPAGGCPGGDDSTRPFGAVLVRRLLAALASLALLGAGAVELLPRGGAAAALGASAAASSGPAAGSQMSAPHGAALLRGTALAVVPGPSGAGAGLPPGSGPVLAAHLVAVSHAGQPTSPLVGVALGSADGRAPPVRAGT